MIKYSIPKLSDQGKEILEALCDIQIKAYMKLSSKDNLESFKDYEILFENLSRAIVINEAIELSKKLASDGAPKFINAILDQIKIEK